MAESTVWWLLVGGAVAVEMVTGTFYLLMLALGLAAGALLAHAGASFGVQLLAVAVISVVAIGTLHWRRGKAVPVAASASKDVNLDVGETVQVHAWSHDGTAHVKYRGAQWTAQAVPGADLAPGPHRVREVVGNRLVLEKL